MTTKLYSLAAVERYSDKNPNSLIATIPGTLLDNYIYAIGKRFLLIKAVFLNEWESAYSIHNFEDLEKCYRKLGFESEAGYKEAGEREGWL
jgi:hypothetical protein